MAEKYRFPGICGATNGIRQRRERERENIRIDLKVYSIYTSYLVTNELHTVGIGRRIQTNSRDSAYIMKHHGAKENAEPRKREQNASRACMVSRSL